VIAGIGLDKGLSRGSWWMLAAIQASSGKAEEEPILGLYRRRRQRSRSRLGVVSAAEGPRDRP